MKRQNTRRKCSHIRWKDVCLGLSIYKMNVMVNNKNLSKYGDIMEKEPTLIEQKFEDAVKNFRKEMEKGKESIQYVLCKL